MDGNIWKVAARQMGGVECAHYFPDPTQMTFSSLRMNIIATVLKNKHADCIVATHRAKIFRFSGSSRFFCVEYDAVPSHCNQ
jgi:hypothetical protein